MPATTPHTQPRCSFLTANLGSAKLGCARAAGHSGSHWLTGNAQRAFEALRERAPECAHAVNSDCPHYS